MDKKRSTIQMDRTPSTHILSRSDTEVNMREPWEYEDERQAQAAKWEALFPKCEICGEHIVEGEDYIDMGFVATYYHAECFLDEYKKIMPDWRCL